LEPGEVRGKILLSKSAILGVLGDPEGMTAALSEASLLIDPGREPRLAFGLQFNLVVDLCHLERFEEAERRLPAVRALAERLGEALELARRGFRQRELAYSYALVSLELALLLLEQGRTAEVRTLAEEMLWIFR